MSTRARSRLAVGATLALVVLTACSNDSGSTPTGTSSPPSEAATSGLDVGAPPGAQILGSFRTGEPFKLTITSSNGGRPTELEITVRSVTCGKPLDAAVIAYAADAVGAPTPTPTPESGKQFCIVAMEAVNVGKSEAGWDADNTVSLNVGDTAYTQTQEDAGYALDYAQYWNSKGRVSPTFGINPGSKGPVHGVFQIPLGDRPTSLWVSSGTAIETFDGVQPGYLVRLS